MWEQNLVSKTGTKVRIFGGLAQLGEHLLCKQKTVSSILTFSITNDLKHDVCTTSTHHPSCFDYWFIQITDYKIQSPIRAVR